METPPIDYRLYVVEEIKGVTSLTRELDREVSCDEVRPVLIEKLSKHLKIPILPLQENVSSSVSNESS